VLKVISRSTFHLQTVLDTLVESAARLCDAERAFVFRPKDGSFYFAAGYGYSQKLREFLAQTPLQPGRGSLVGRTALEKTVIQITDTKADPEFTFARPPKLGPSRSMLGVPLIRDGTLIGVMGFARTTVKSFNAKETELATTFANQAIIAIENARLLNELRQSLEQQTATSEVLQVISSSPGDLEPVFVAMLAKAVRICDAKYGTLYLCEDGRLRLVAAHDVPEYFAARKGAAFDPAPGGGLDAVMSTKRPIQIPDLAATKSYTERHPGMVEAVELAGIRTGLAVPMLKDDDLIGIVAIHRREVLPFTDKQIDLVKNFAAQAVIAIENARLLNELRQRTTDLTEALEQQTATSEVLRVISSSPGDLQPVFATLLENAVRLCGANFGNLFLYENDGYRVVAMHNAPESYANIRRGVPFHPPPGSGLGRLTATKEFVQIADLMLEDIYKKGDPLAVTGVTHAGIRTLLAVPMLKEDHLVGAIVIYRQEVRPFADKQIALVANFAAQAVIAIENARLLNELRERTGQLEAQSQEVLKLNQQLEHRVTDQVGEIERMGRLRRFLPPQVADLIVTSGTEKQLESHRREITALFCDLRGYTGFTEIADAEDVMALLRDYHAAIGEIIIKYSGTLERYAGDGVMVIFNDPVPIENPALQAVRMALEMRVAIGELTDKWRQLGHEIGFGIGIAHGYATLGTIGFEGRFDYAAIGTVSNVASRLCDEAKPGQILISPRVLIAVKDAVTVEPVGEFELKGIRRPVAAYNVLAATPEN
jgi:GAF domain-containing protein